MNILFLVPNTFVRKLPIMIAATTCILCAAPVKILTKGEQIDVLVDGRPFTTLHQGRQARKPFLHPLRTASGKAVTRGFPVDPQPSDPTDHPHQRGLWIGAEHLSGMDFWENDPSYRRPRMGTIVFKDVLAEKEEKDRAAFTILAHWVSPEGVVVVSERRKMTFSGTPHGCRTIDIDLSLEAKTAVTFEDHHDAVIGIRLAPQFDEKNGGRVRNAEGLSGEAGVRGVRSAWLDWQAVLDGERVGVALFDSPRNFKFPTRWHVRSMGLMVANPFAEKNFSPAAADGSRTLSPGETLRLRYRLLIHPEGVNLQEMFKNFSQL